MPALAVAVLLCWVMVFAARPRRPLLGDEVQELVYSRLLGRQQMLTLLALFATAMMLLMVVISMPQRLDPDLRTVRQAREACTAARHAASDAADYGLERPAYCYELQPGGMWAERVERSDGTWLLVATLASPPVFARATTARESALPPLSPDH
jgi:hypothetical protein